MHFNWMECIQMLCTTIIYTIYTILYIKEKQMHKISDRIKPSVFSVKL